MGLKEDILGCDDLKSQVVAVPEWNQTVTIRAFTGAERDAWEQRHSAAAKAGTPLQNVRGRLVALIVVDEQGQRVFADADADALGGKSAKALDRIFDAFLKLNKIGADEAAELEKNS